MRFTPSGGDDEDGVLFTSALITGQNASLNVTASVTGYLYTWIDFGADGSWAEAGDLVFNGTVLNPGVNNLTFTVPNSAAIGATYARFRFVSTAVAALGYGGSAPDGEVEDYQVDIREPDLEIKWSQPPVFNPESPYPDCFWGWDEISIYDADQFPIVADDWLCSDPRPITDIHWWGSYEGYQDDVPPAAGPDAFHIGIWTDVPAGITEPWSHPGQMIHEWVVPRTQLNEQYVGCDFHPEFMAITDSCFHYDFIIPQEEWFYQEGENNIYWISIAAIYPQGVPDVFPWGWKTRPHYFNDDAVRIYDPFAPILGDFFVGGQPIEDEQGNSWDMAFELTTASECVKSDAPFYAEWVGAGKPWARPNCWCFQRQCRGDVDGYKVGLFRVQASDLSIFASAFNKADLKLTQTSICADLDHKKVGLFRCQADDLSTFAAYFNKADLKVPPCPIDWDGDSDDDYNFWTTP